MANDDPRKMKVITGWPAYAIITWILAASVNTAIDIIRWLV